MLYVSHSVEETREFAAQQAQELTRKDREPSSAKASEGKAIVIALEGELGAGKTTFTQAFAKALGVDESVKSPTFVLMKQYPIVDVPGYTQLYHLDCYRLNDSNALVPLGIPEIMQKTGAIILIEWAERVADILPREHVVVHIDHIPARSAGGSEHERNIIVIKSEARSTKLEINSND